ncbi:MAG: LysE family transporter [Elusimicrobiota bacterium]
MDILTLFTMSFMIAFSGALVPGPLMTAVINDSTKHGSKTGPLFVLGHALLEIVMITIIILGFSKFINTPFVITTISITGSVFLFILGAMMLYSIPGLTLDFLKDKTPSSGKNLILNGILMSLSNPYWTIWWFSIGIGLVISAQHAGIFGLLAFFIGHELADLAVYWFISFTISKSRNFLSLTLYKTLIGGCAAALIIFALYFGLTTFLAGY